MKRTWDVLKMYGIVWIRLERRRRIVFEFSCCHSTSNSCWLCLVLIEWSFAKYPQQLELLMMILIRLQFLFRWFCFLKYSQWGSVHQARSMVASLASIWDAPMSNLGIWLKKSNWRIHLGCAALNSYRYCCYTDFESCMPYAWLV